MAKAKPRHVLAIGAHPDDIELGCGGTLLQHRSVGDIVTMLVMTGGELGANADRGRRKEAEKAAKTIGATLIPGPFFDGSVPLTSETVDVIEKVINQRKIDTVYVHCPSDAHQDHLLVARATLAATRKMHRILFYQSPSTVEFHPTMFVDIKKHLDKKLKALSCHASQVDGSPTMDLEVVRSTAHYWGSRGRLKYAEPFEPYRFAWNITPRVEKLEHLDPSKKKQEIGLLDQFDSFQPSHSNLGYAGIGFLHDDEEGEF